MTSSFGNCPTTGVRADEGAEVTPTEPTTELDPRLSTGFTTLIGLKITAASGDEVRAELNVGPDLLQPNGILHGGVHCTLVETLASIGGALWLGEDVGPVVGVSNSTDFLRATQSGMLFAAAAPIHRGRSQQLWEVRITDAADRLVAKGQVRLQNLRTSERAPKS